MPPALTAGHVQSLKSSPSSDSRNGPRRIRARRSWSSRPTCDSRRVFPCGVRRYCDHVSQRAKIASSEASENVGSRVAPRPRTGVSVLGTGEVSKRGKVICLLICVVEDDASHMPAARPQTANTVSEVHAVEASAPWCGLGARRTRQHRPAGEGQLPGETAYEDVAP